MTCVERQGKAEGYVTGGGLRGPGDETLADAEAQDTAAKTDARRTVRDARRTARRTVRRRREADCARREADCAARRTVRGGLCEAGCASQTQGWKARVSGASDWKARVSGASDWRE